MAQEFRDADALAAAAGRSLGHTPWLEVTQERIDRFADATEDRQWIHVDVARARQGQFGRPIAHGYLTLSLVSHFLPQLLRVPRAKLGLHCGCSRVRFSAPVPVGSRIRGSGELLEAQRLPGGVEVLVRMSVEVEGSAKPACVAELLTRFLF